MHMIRRRRKTALLLGAALLLLMEVSRRRLLPTALWSVTEQGNVVRKDGLQAGGLAGDAISNGLRRQALGKNDLSNELTDSKTSRQDSTNNTIDKPIPGGGSNNTMRTQEPQINSLHTRLTNGNASDILNKQVLTDDGLSKIPADGAKDNISKKESSTHNILPIGIAHDHDISVIDDTLSGRVLVNDRRTVEDNLIKREPMKNDLTEGLTGGAIGDTLGRQAVANDVLSNNSWKSANNGFSKGSNEETNSKIFNRRAPTDSGLKITSIKGPEHSVSGHVSTRTCRKKTNLVFLKTHKTASSTVQNIIMRFGSARNLTFVLPAEDNNIGWPGLFKRYYVLQERSRRKNITYNILCHHTRFNYSNIRELMPDDTMYITIVRNPADMYESIFYYFGLDKYFRIHSRNPLKKFLGNPYYYVKKNARPPYQLYRNPMFYDLGYIRTEYVSEQTIKSDIGFLEKIFSVVMVADYFEESLILMKHTLCWDIDDVTFFKMNARREESIRHVTKEMAGKIRSWNKADAMLFDHFNKTLWFKLSQLPFDWRKEVEVLKARNRRLQEECIESDNVRNAEIKDIRFKVFQPDGITIKGFQVKESARMNETCVNMAKSELPFTHELQAKERLKYHITDYKGNLHKHQPQSQQMPDRGKKKPNNDPRLINQNLIAKRNLPPVFEMRDKEKQKVDPLFSNQNLTAEKKPLSLLDIIVKIHEKEIQKLNPQYSNQNFIVDNKIPSMVEMPEKNIQKPNPQYSNQNFIVEKKFPSILETREKNIPKPNPQHSNQNMNKVLMLEKGERNIG